MCVCVSECVSMSLLTLKIEKSLQWSRALLESAREKRKGPASVSLISVGQTLRAFILSHCDSFDAV